MSRTLVLLRVKKYFELVHLCLLVKKVIYQVYLQIYLIEDLMRGVIRVVKARFNRLTRVSNVEPFAYEDE